MSDHDDRYPGGEFWSNEEDDGDNSDYDSFNGEDEEINVDSYEFLGSLICQDEDELNSTDSVFRNGHIILEQRTKFDPAVAGNIDNQLSYQDVISLIFLTMDRMESKHIKFARRLCLEVEKKEKNLGFPWKKEILPLMKWMYRVITEIGGNKWSSSMFEAFYQIGLKRVLMIDMGINMEKEEKKLEDAGNIDKRRMMLYNFAEYLVSSEQEELMKKLQVHHPSLKKAKMMETVFLQLLDEKEDKDDICKMLVNCIDGMENRDNLIKILKEKDCRSNKCSVHNPNKTESYPKGPGICIIINQKRFKERTKDLEDRNGTDRDRDELKVTFTKLGVRDGDLKVYNDLTDTEMREKIEAVARMANARPDCCWVGVVILSHGRQVLGEDEVLGVNGRGLKQSTIMKAFSAENCRNLQEKPKLFLFQACRNRDIEASELARLDREEKQRSPPEPMDSSISSVNQLPSLMNYLVGNATVAGAMAYRNTEGGSFFIQTLCNVLKEFADREPMSDMSLRVNREVSEFHNRFTSLSEFKNTLTKKFWFQVTEESIERAAEMDRNLV